MTDADDLLQRALIDAESCAAVALKVSDLALAEALTVIFHGRRDLGTLQTYVAHGGRAAGSAVGASELLRVPCDLDLAEAGSRDEAEELYAEQARALRDAIVAADTVLAVWAGPLAARDRQRRRRRPLDRARRQACPPTASCRSPSRRPSGACSSPRSAARARSSQGPPPMGIVCAQQDLVHVYPLLRRSRELPRGLRGARRRPRPPHRRAARPPGGVGPALPRAQRRRLPPDRLKRHRRREPRHAPVMTGRVKRRSSSSRSSSSSSASFVVARWINNDTVERARVVELLREQLRGDATAMLRRLEGCDDPACVAVVRANARRLRRDAELKIALYQSQTAHAVRSRTKFTRVVWFPRPRGADDRAVRARAPRGQRVRRDDR